VALPNQDIKMEAQWYAALMSKKMQSHENSSALMIFTHFQTLHLSAIKHAVGGGAGT
jgi:hypothetical protein